MFDLRNAPDHNAPHDELQIGKQYPDGTTHWADEFNLTGLYSKWRTEKGRGEEQDAYRLQLQSVGIAPTDETRLTFVYRTRHVSFSDSVTITEAK